MNGGFGFSVLFLKEWMSNFPLHEVPLTQATPLPPSLPAFCCVVSRVGMCQFEASHTNYIISTNVFFFGFLNFSNNKKNCERKY